MPLPVCVYGPRLIASAFESLLHSIAEVAPCEVDSAQVVVLLGEGWREGLQSIKGQSVGLVLVANGTPEDLQCASKEGIHAFIHANDGVGELSSAIGAAARADDYCSHTLLPSLLEALRRGSENGQAPAREPSPALSMRELEIAHYAAEGFSNAEIAHRAGVSVATVKFHLAAAYRKTGIRGRSELRLILGQPAP